MMAGLATILLTASFQMVFWDFGFSSTVNLERCPPPDYPEFGDYGPKQSIYFPGDVIHYFCGTKYYIGGNYRRLCMDSGSWSGDAPVCDGAADISEFSQSSTAQPDRTNDASRAIDGDRETCSKTLGEANGAEWIGILRDFAREVLRFMLFFPKSPVSYEVFILRRDGSEWSCGQNKDAIIIHDWLFHNCVPPNHTNAVAVKVKSLTNQPLEICEVMVHTLTDPTCVDPHFNVVNGRLRLTRKTATLECNEGYTRSAKSPEKLDCIRTGVWSRRNLRCEKDNFEVVDMEGVQPQGEGPIESKEPDVSRKGVGPVQPKEPEVSGNGEGASQPKEPEVDGKDESSLHPGEPKDSEKEKRPVQTKELEFLENGERPSQPKEPEVEGNEKSSLQRGEPEVSQGRAIAAGRTGIFTKQRRIERKN